MQSDLHTALLRLLGLLIIVLAAQGCAGAHQDHAAGGPRTPAPAADEAAVLDGLPPLPADQARPRSASAESDQTVLGSDTFSRSEFADPVGDTLVLQSSPAAPLQYGIYEFPLAGNTAVRFTADIAVDAGPYFIAAGNYARGGWELSGPLTAASPQYQLTPGADFASPGDAVYVAVIAARVDDADARITVNSATLTSDDEVIPTYTLDGLVTDGLAAPLEGVSVQVSPGDLLDITDESGMYEFGGLEPGDYLVAPTLAGYLISPPTQEVTIVDSDVSLPDFIATENKLVAGRVTEGPGSGISGVALHLVAINENGSINSGGYRMATTDAEGFYEFEAMVAGDYRLIPQADGYVFTPNIVEFTFSETLDQNFAGQAVSLPAVVNYIDHMRPWLFEPVCMNCHDSAKSGAERNFAPTIVNWDSYGGTSEFYKGRGNIRVQADTMPPLTLHFKTTPFHKDLFQRWLDGGFQEN